jgi:hypothetical protein
MTSTITRFLYFRLGLGFLLLGGLSACKKEKELVPTDKVYSWSEVKQVPGAQKIILGMSADANSVYLQEASFFGAITPIASGRNGLSFPSGYYSLAYSNLPSDINVHIPMGPRFFATPLRGAGDSTLVLYPNTAPVTSIPYNPDGSSAGSYIRLRVLDKQATRYIPNEVNSFSRFGGINSNDYLLFGYQTSTVDDTNLHFVLVRGVVDALHNYALATDARTIRIPISTPAGYIRSITAIDDYFLVDCAVVGLFKVEQDGSYQQVYNAPTTITSFYKWQGTVYGVEFFNGSAILTSTDNGDSWQRHTGIPSYFRYSTFSAVGDSLVGITHGVSTNILYTLRWQGTNFQVRELKNDGLGQAGFTDLVQLGDTAYLGTANGLFKKPLKTLFDSQP